MCISFLPFPTAVLAEHMREGNHRTQAVMFYGATFTVIAFAWNALWLYASHGHRLLSHDVSAARLRVRTRRNLLGPVMYGITIPLALISAWISMLYLLPQDEAWRTEHTHTTEEH
ncbi:MAG: hypothetical protein M3P30_09685 [Chloroflexota bacterium]|nr:hypothetical protein [Chloroflexota bacterium]